MTEPSSWWFVRSSVVGARVIAVVVAASTASCGVEGAPEAPAQVAVAASALTAEQRLAACAQDPRVVTGLASARICAGSDIFFRETFQGNGRTCGSCHPVENNFTIDPAFIATLPQTDPLFVFKNDPNLAGLETPSLESIGGILENVDDFADPTHKFVIRAVPHLLSLVTSITRDENDPNTLTSTEDRTGWSGDGGNLHEFLNTAIKQHYTKRLDRVEGVDFRFATSQELDLVEEFQLGLGRLNELDFTQVNVFDAQAQEGKAAYLDPLRGRCQVCHANGGANFQATGRNRNFDTGTRFLQAGGTTIPVFDGGPLFDGGFGGQGLTQPNVNVEVQPPKVSSVHDGFGNNTFNTPPIIEAADTLPAFHTNAFGGSIEGVVSFYGNPAFLVSDAARDLDKQFGAPVNVNPDIASIGRFLRALNVVLNLDMAKQRLRASQTILNRFQDQQLAIQRRLIELAVAEIDDALEVLQNGTTQPFYPVAVDRLNLAKTEIAAALAGATSRSARARCRTRSRESRMRVIRSAPTSHSRSAPATCSSEPPHRRRAVRRSAGARCASRWRRSIARTVPPGSRDDPRILSGFRPDFGHRSEIRPITGQPGCDLAALAWRGACSRPRA